MNTLEKILVFTSLAGSCSAGETKDTIGFTYPPEKIQENRLNPEIKEIILYNPGGPGDEFCKEYQRRIKEREDTLNDTNKARNVHKDMYFDYNLMQYVPDIAKSDLTTITKTAGDHDCKQLKEMKKK